MINIERILTTEELQTLETEQVYTATIEATQTSEILQFIAKTLPKLEGLEHVKRVKRQQPSGRLSVILCQGSKLDEQKLVEVFQKEDRWSTLVIDKAEVPRTPPYTKQQYEEWKTLWPVSFRPLEKLRKQRLPDEETGYVEGMFRELEQLAEDSSRGATIIVDKRSKEVLARYPGQMGLPSNPLRHSVMCCVDLVGRKEVEKRKRKEEAGMENPGYLCENADVFCLNEPCIMCCMALIHSRIGRLFFVHKSQEVSGSISVYRLHDNPRLNHHFTAFQIAPVLNR